MQRGPSSAKPNLRPRALNVRLSIMYFLDIAVPATYVPLLALHMRRSLGFSPAETSYVFAMVPVAALVSPSIVGFIADRVLHAERSLTGVNVLRALALVCAAETRQFWPFLWSIAAVGFFSAPSFVLTNTISFQHLPDPRGLGRARVWGTVSWLLMLWVVGAFLGRFSGTAAQLEHTHTAFLIGAGTAFAVAIYALTLPSTPPSHFSKSPFAFLHALRLLKNESFAALMLVTALTAIVAQFNLMLQGLFYTDARGGLGLDVASANRAASVAQILEVALIPMLGLLIHRFGVRGVLLVGIGAWPFRFVAYILGQPTWFVISAQLLHGLNFALGGVGMQVAVDSMAERHLRASAQALLITVTQGIGSLAGQIACGQVLTHYTLSDGSMLWRRIYTVPLAISVLGTLLLFAFFREPGRVPAETEPRVRG